MANDADVNAAPFIALVPGLTLPFLGALAIFAAASHDTIARYVFGVTKLILLALPFVIIWRWGHAKLSSPFTAQRVRVIAEGIAVGVMMSVVLLWIMLVPGIGVMKAAAPQVIATARQFGAADLSGFLLLACSMSLVHAAFEEGYWRVFIFGQLTRRFPLWAAHIIAGVAFAANHVVSGWAYAGPTVGLTVGAVVAVAGVMWSMLYSRHGTVLGCWIAHVICDGSLFYVEWLMFTGRI